MGNQNKASDQGTNDVLENAKAIVELVGGTSNINTVSHCFTRLRFRLKDRSKADDEAIRNAPGVIDFIDAGGQMQIVIGKQVETYYDAVLEAYPSLNGEGEVPDEGQQDKSNMSAMDYVVDFASAVFVPCVGLLAACGTLQGILALLTYFNALSADSGTYTVLYIISNSIFYYFPILVAYNTAKYFGGKPFYSTLIALIMIYPTFIDAADSGETIKFLGISLNMIDYSSQILPAIAASWFACVVEKYARKIIPDVVKVIFVPMAVLVITVPVALIVIGPVMSWIMDLITAAVFALIDFSPVLTGLIVGAAWQPLVFLGISKAFVAVFVSDLATYGYDVLIPITFIICAIAQGAAALAYCLRSKNVQTRQVGISAFVSALFGITEPAMFGLNVTARKPFIYGIVASSIGGLISVVMGGKGYSIASGVLGIASLIGPEGIDMGFWGAIIGMVVAFVIAFGLTWFFGYDEETDHASKQAIV